MEMSFEFLTSEKYLGIPKDMLAVTCFEGDENARRDTWSASFWKKVGIPEERIGFLPKAKNWWGPAGKTGPCGPDTEMFYWVGEGKPRGNPATHDKEWLEIWNDVLMQYEKTEEGSFIPLKQQNVDTGMGLERVAKVLQGVPSVYDTDRLKPIVDKVCSLSPLSPPSPVGGGGKGGGEIRERHSRIVVDHIKAATFVIADGIRPSNVDQGYVLRKLIRRAVRSMRMLGSQEGLFTATIARAVIEQYGHVYPLIQKKEAEICEILSGEEQQFGKTLQEGLKRFSKATENMSGSIIDGQTAFHLYDTYGFPLELTKEMAAEQKLTVDEAGFAKAFEQHQALSRAGAEKKFAGGLADHSAETTKLHTATHLLNAALRKVLGSHVQQKGSNITAERLRFDFNHPDKMTPEQIQEVEKLVNEAIQADFPVAYHLTSVDGAKKEGAIGVFDERYGNEVKVYVVGDGSFSKEICGGPHVARTGMLGSFKIQKEESSSAGIRRIKAVIANGPAEIQVAGEA